MITQTHCCGMHELEYVGDANGPEDAMIQFCSEATGWSRDGLELNALYWFAGVVKEGYAEKFAAYIKRHKLGSVVQSRIRMNPGSGNKLRAFIWAPNNRNMSAWYRKHITQIKEERG